MSLDGELKIQGNLIIHEFEIHKVHSIEPLTFITILTQVIEEKN